LSFPSRSARLFTHLRASLWSRILAAMAGMRSFRRLAPWSAPLWIVGAGLVHAAGASGSGAAPAAPDLGAERRADLEYAGAAYVAKSMAFDAGTRQAAQDYIAGILPRVGTMSETEFLLAVARIPAFAGNAHDVFDSGADSWWPETRLPVKLVWFPDALVIARAAPEQAALVGARITRVEDLAPDELLGRLRAICGGTGPYRRWNTVWVLGSGGFLHALGLARSADALRLELEMPDGSRRTVRMPYVPEASMPAGLRPTRLLARERSDEELARGWVVAGAAAEAPLYLQQPDVLYRAQRLGDLDALYVQLRSNVDEQGQHLAPFLEATLAAARAAPPRRLVLDLRFDVGGNIDLSRAFLRELVKLTRERIYVLVSRYTFSAGIVSAAAVKHDGGSRVTLVGEEVGDRLRFWSEGEDACLPHSRYCLRPTSGLWDLERGCKGTPGCYGDAYDATAGSLRPDLPAPLTAAAWLAGSDLAMEAVRADLSRR
jgi:hypothetical protein